MTAELTATRRDRSLILTFSTPGAGNALDEELLSAAIETLSKAERDDAIGTVIITAVGDDFYRAAPVARDSAERDRLAQSLHSWIETLFSFPKPLLAAVEGMAADGGLAMVLACDLIVAGQSAKFAITQEAASGGADWFLQRAVPRQLAQEFLLVNTPLPAERLHAAGIVNRLAPDGTALEAALTLGQHIDRRHAAQLAAMKARFADAVGASLSGHLAAERHALVAAGNR